MAVGGAVPVRLPQQIGVAMMAAPGYVAMLNLLSDHHRDQWWREFVLAVVFYGGIFLVGARRAA